MKTSSELIEAADVAFDKGTNFYKELIAAGLSRKQADDFQSRISQDRAALAGTVDDLISEIDEIKRDAIYSLQEALALLQKLK